MPGGCTLSRNRRTAIALVRLGQKGLDVGGELGVVLEQEPVGRVEVDLQPGPRDQAGEQPGVARQDHRVAVAVGHEDRVLDGGDPLQRRVVGDAPVADRVVLGLDNADSRVPWLPDALATYATGQRYRLRKLYTTNEELAYTPRAILLISSRDPRFNRADVVERRQRLGDELARVEASLALNDERRSPEDIKEAILRARQAFPLVPVDIWKRSKECGDVSLKDSKALCDELDRQKSALTRA